MLLLPDLQKVAPHKPVKPGKKRRNSKSALRQTTAGLSSYREEYWSVILRQVSAACDVFWLRTPERRAILANRLSKLPKAKK